MMRNGCDNPFFCKSVKQGKLPDKTLFNGGGGIWSHAFGDMPIFSTTYDACMSWKAKNSDHH
jgi:hypothetical protein